LVDLPELEVFCVPLRICRAFVLKAVYKQSKTMVKKERKSDWLYKVVKVLVYYVNLELYEDHRSEGVST